MCVLISALWNTCMDLILDRIMGQCHCGASVNNPKATDLDFVDDAVILAITGDPSDMALEALHKK